MTSLFILLGIVNPFVTDGCTYFLEGTPREPKLWAECCLEHDLRYWVGGTEKAREGTDLLLRDCVKAKGHPVIAELMYYAVRIGKNSPRKDRAKQWSNAWEVPGYSKLTSEQISEIKAELPKLSIPREMELRLLESIELDSK